MNEIHLKELYEKFKRGTKKERISYVIIAVITIIAMILVSAYVLGIFLNFLENPISFLAEDSEKQSYWKLIVLGLSKSLPLCIAFGIILSYFLLYMMTKVKIRNKPKYYDEDRKIYFMDNATMGGQRYLTRKEMEDEFVIDDVKKDEITMSIYGQLSTDGKQVLGYKKRTNGPSGSQNVMILAPMGTGKSFGPVRVNLLQAVRRGESFVVTDPKGELYSSLAYYCKQQGMNVHVLNLAEPRYSEFWNVMEEVLSPETERLDSSRLNDFAQVYMQNSNSTTSPPNEYWYACAINVIRSAVGLIAYNHENEIIDNYVELYKKIKGITDDSDHVVNLFKNTMIAFPECRRIILEAAQEENLDLEVINKAIKKAENTYSTKLNLSTVFDTLLNFGDKSIQESLKKISENATWHPASTAYKMFKQNDDPQVTKSAMSNATMRFQIFADDALKNILSYDGLHCADITAKHSAYFIILSDKTETTKPIASLFFNFLFKDVQDEFDKEQSIAMAEGRPNGRRQLTAMLDEFYAVGVIGGKPSAFGQVMSSSRSREIHIWIILQTISQLPALYGEEVANIIISGCSSILYLGGNDPETIEFIRSYVAGKSTVLTESHAETGGLLGASTSSNVSSSQRDFLTAAEAKEWHNKILIAKQASYLVKAKPFPWIEHPCFPYCQNISVYKEVEPIEVRMLKIKDYKPKKEQTKNQYEEAIKKSYLDYISTLNFVKTVEEKKDDYNLTIDTSKVDTDYDSLDDMFSDSTGNTDIDNSSNSDKSNTDNQGKEIYVQTALNFNEGEEDENVNDVPKEAYTGKKDNTSINGKRREKANKKNNVNSLGG